MNHIGLPGLCPLYRFPSGGRALSQSIGFHSGRALSSLKHCLFQIAKRAFTKVREAL